MTRIGRLRALATAATLPLLLASGARAASEVRVESWSGSWSFGDDFGDGVFPDGDGDEVRLYDAPCGNVDDAGEAAGRLRLVGPGTQCSGGLVVAQPRVLIGPQLRIRALFLPAWMPGGVAFGISLRTPDGQEQRELVFERGDLLGGGSDAVGVSLYVNGAPFEQELVSTSTAAYFGGPIDTIELELTGTAQGDGTYLHGRYRGCPLAGCSDSTPFLPLSYAGGSAWISARDTLGVAFLGAGAVPYTLDLLEWQVDTSVSDPFDGSFGDRIDYQTECADVRVEAGGLVATPASAPCGSSWLGAGFSGPGESSLRATFAWSTPEPCTDGVGVGLFADPASVPSFDGAVVLLRRGPLPGVGDDVLFAVLETESELPDRPWLEAAVLSTTPDAPPAHSSIELWLELSRAGPGAPLLPHAKMRTCYGVDCSAWPLQDLQPFVFPQDDPGFLHCGVAAAHFAPSADGGAVDPLAPLIPTLLLAPEAGSGGASALAILGVAWLSRFRSRRERPGGE